MHISAQHIADNNHDLLVLAQLSITLKNAISSMVSLLDRLPSHTEAVLSSSAHLTAADQLNNLRSTLNAQIHRQKLEASALRSSLQIRVQAEVHTILRTRLRQIVSDSLRQTIQEKVAAELATQIPEDLREQVISHQRQIMEVKTALHNSEARRYNALQTTSTARLRPLLRPLPTPEQSPIAPSLMSRANSNSGANIPVSPAPPSAFPLVPAPTPIRRSSSNSLGRLDFGPPTASALFPSDLGALFALDPESTRRLLRDYGLVSTDSTPVLERPPRSLPVVAEDDNASFDVDLEEESGSGDEVEAHAADMNKFMAHIGVPFLMVPAPKAKEDTNSSMTSRMRRKTMLAPLIIE